MTKSELIASIIEKLSNLNEKTTAFCVNHIIEEMASELGRKGRIEVRDFGSFSLHYQAPRQAHNPKTGEKVFTKGKYSVHFKPGKRLKQLVNTHGSNENNSV